MLSAIVQKVTGQKVIDYLTPRLFRPLGIEGMTWETCPRGINTGGWGLKVTTESLAKFGQLYLQRGVWNGRQLLPAAWVEEATTFKIQQPAPDLERKKKESDWHQGYCYQFWRCRHNAFRGDGAFGQFTIVMPDQDAVVVITSESPSLQGEVDLVWEHLLPALKEKALPANKAGQGQLKKVLSSLALLPPDGQPTSPTVARISGKQFDLDSNESGFRCASLRFQHHGCVFTLRDDKKEYPVTCGIGRWAIGQIAMPGEPPKMVSDRGVAEARVAACGTWKDENTFQMTWRFFETPHHDTVTCRFEGDRLKVEFLSSIAAISPARKDKRPVLQGQLRV